LRASSSQAINHPPSNNLELHTTTRHWQVPSVPSTSSSSAPACYSLVFILLTPIATRGWRAFVRRNLGFNHKTHIKINLAKYQALCAKGIPHTIPTMCVLSIKKNEMLNPLCAKSSIVVLGNHEDRVWTKSKKYAPVLHPDTMRLMVSMAVKRRRTLKQGGCKNAFCPGILPNNKITIIKPPIGGPNAKKDKYWLLKRTLYGLH
jgi:hypothetical protein